MSLVPRWQYMTDEAKSLTKKLAISAGVLIIMLMLLRGLLPLAVFLIVAWWVWHTIKK
jgi:flagellar basal body-associated protein FliL